MHIRLKVYVYTRYYVGIIKLCIAVGYDDYRMV